MDAGMEPDTLPLGELSEYVDKATLPKDGVTNVPFDSVSEEKLVPGFTFDVWVNMGKDANRTNVKKYVEVYSANMNKKYIYSLKQKSGNWREQVIYVYQKIAAAIQQTAAGNAAPAASPAPTASGNAAASPAPTAAAPAALPASAAAGVSTGASAVESAVEGESDTTDDLHDKGKGKGKGAVPTPDSGPKKLVIKEHINKAFEKLGDCGVVFNIGSTFVSCDVKVQVDEWLAKGDCPLYYNDFFMTIWESDNKKWLYHCQHVGSIRDSVNWSMSIL